MVADLQKSVQPVLQQESLQLQLPYRQFPCCILDFAVQVVLVVHLVVVVALVAQIRFVVPSFLVEAFGCNLAYQ